MRAFVRLRLQRCTMMFMSGAALICCLMLTPSNAALARTKPPTDMGDPDPDEGQRPGTGMGSIASQKFLLTSISPPTSIAATTVPGHTSAKMSIRYLLRLWLQFRIR
jgi:hypothetical protein